MKQLAKENIKYLRKNLNMSQERVAEMVGCHACTISRIETGKCIPYRRNYERIFNALGGYGIDYDLINKRSGYYQDQMTKRVIEALECWKLEAARQCLTQLAESIDFTDKFDRQLIMTLELILTRMEMSSECNLKENFIEMLMITRSQDEICRLGEYICLSRVELLVINNLALCYLDEGDVNKAISIFKFLIKNCDKSNDIPFVERTRAVLYNNLGLCYLKTNQPQRAINYFDKGLLNLKTKGGISLMFGLLLLKSEALKMMDKTEDAMPLEETVRLGCSILGIIDSYDGIFDDFQQFDRGICVL